MQDSFNSKDTVHRTLGNDVYLNQMDEWQMAATQLSIQCTMYFIDHWRSKLFKKCQRLRFFLL